MWFEEVNSQSLTSEQSNDPQWIANMCCTRVKDRAFYRGCLEISVPKVARHPSDITTVTVTSRRLKMSNQSICSSCLVQLQYYPPLRVQIDLFLFFSVNWKSLITCNTFDHKNELIISNWKVLFIFSTNWIWKKKTCQKLHGCEVADLVWLRLH